MDPTTLLKFCHACAPAPVNDFSDAAKLLTPRVRLPCLPRIVVTVFAPWVRFVRDCSNCASPDVPPVMVDMNESHAWFSCSTFDACSPAAMATAVMSFPTTPAGWPIDS